jgi:hypothetical protein
MNEEAILEKVGAGKPVCWHLTNIRFCFGTVVGTETCTLQAQIACKGNVEANACKRKDCCIAF